MKNAVYTLLILTLAGCVSAPLSDQEKAVRILKKSDAPANCKEIKKIVSGGLSSFTDEGREENLKRACAKVGGNLVTLDKTDENNTLYGTAYNCPQI